MGLWELITRNFFDLQKNPLGPWLLYNPVVPSIIPDIFSDRSLAYDSSVHLAQWLQKYIGKKGSLGKIFSVAHAAFQFARFIGCAPIIFIGQDLSFSKNRLHSRHSYYYRQREDAINKYKSMEYLDQEKYHLYLSNLLERIDIFDKNPSVVKLRNNLISEEVGELVEAFQALDVVEMIDALSDIQYVAYGLQVVYGIDGDKLFREYMINKFDKEHMNII